MLEANSKRDAAMAEIENDCENLKRQQIEKVAAAIKAESDKLSAVEAAAKTRLDMQADKLNAMKKEVTEFKRKLMVMLDQQIKSAVALPMFPRSPKRLSSPKSAPRRSRKNMRTRPRLLSDSRNSRGRIIPQTS